MKKSRKLYISGSPCAKIVHILHFRSFAISLLKSFQLHRHKLYLFCRGAVCNLKVSICVQIFDWFLSRMIHMHVCEWFMVAVKQSYVDVVWSYGDVVWCMLSWMLVDLAVRLVRYALDVRCNWLVDGEGNDQYNCNKSMRSRTDVVPVTKTLLLLHPIATYCPNSRNIGYVFIVVATQLLSYFYNVVHISVHNKRCVQVTVINFCITREMLSISQEIKCFPA